MRKEMLLGAILVTFMTLAGNASAKGLDALSTWVNQSGSYMSISYVLSDGSFMGSYINNAQGTGCQGTPYTLSGRSVGDTLGFTVSWNNGTQNCNSTTSWTGYLDSSGNIITKWNLATPNSIYSGADTFTPVSMKKDAPMMMK